MKKVYKNAKEALDGLLFDGMLIAAGGFGLCGIPELLIAAIKDADNIHLPGVYVHRLIQGKHEKRIEQRTTRKRAS